MLTDYIGDNMIKGKRYTKKGNTIIDSGSTFYELINGEIHCSDNNPNVKFWMNPVIGDEAKEMWKDLLDRVNNKRNPYYYQPPPDGVYRR